uniref:Uncharacterized protein n=1 Tax=Panagrellus redivivus TaxID=6233 RepID=A0A7E4UR59_PANRE
MYVMREKLQLTMDGAARLPKRKWQMFDDLASKPFSDLGRPSRMQTAPIKYSRRRQMALAHAHLTSLQSFLPSIHLRVDWAKGKMDQNRSSLARHDQKYSRLTKSIKKVKREKLKSLILAKK